MLCLSSLASALVSLVLALLSVHTSPWHRVRKRNFIFGIHMPICSPYTHIKYLVILTCSFQMAAILVFFFDLLSCLHSHRNFIFIMNMYICPYYMLITFLVILTFSFQMAAILVLFFDLLSCPHT